MHGTKPRLPKRREGMNSMSIRASVSFFVIGLLVLAVLAFAVYMMPQLRQPEILLTIVVLAGVVVLLAALGGLFALLRGSGVHDPREALGLPQGSIRALIALSLILIFATISVYLIGLVNGYSA